MLSILNSKIHGFNLLKMKILYSKKLCSVLAISMCFYNNVNNINKNLPFAESKNIATNDPKRSSENHQHLPYNIKSIDYFNEYMGIVRNLSSFSFSKCFKRSPIFVWHIVFSMKRESVLTLFKPAIDLDAASVNRRLWSSKTLQSQ